MGIAINSILQKIKDYFVKFNPNSIDIDDAGKIAHENIAELKNSGYEGEKDMESLATKDKRLDGYLSAVDSRGNINLEDTLKF
ncbi:MAG: hypothetical protein ACTTJC_08515 [Campylobacter sp.]